MPPTIGVAERPARGGARAEPIITDAPMTWIRRHENAPQPDPADSSTAATVSSPRLSWFVFHEQDRVLGQNAISRPYQLA